MEACTLIERAQRAIVEWIEREYDKSSAHASFFETLQQIVTWPHNPAQPPHPLQYLPALTCWAAHGDPQQTVPLIAAWQLLRRAAKLFDDVADGDVTQPSSTANFGMGVLLLAQQLLQLEGSSSRVLAVHDALAQHLLRACAGQHSDLSYQIALESPLNPDGWFAIAQAKSGEFAGWACWAGAHWASASVEVERALRRYGTCVGVLLQLADDYCDVWGPQASAASLSATALPVGYGRYVAAPELGSLLKQMIENSAAAEAHLRDVQHLLEQQGAKCYMHVIADQLQAEARQVLAEVDLHPAARRELERLTYVIWYGPKG